MNTTSAQTLAMDSVPTPVELYHSLLDNLVQVKNCAGGVVVRLTRDNLTARAKTCLIRHLAVEGFIPDRYQWYSEDLTGPSLEVKWVIDGSWVTFQHQLKRLTTRVLNRLTFGRLLALSLFLTALAAAEWRKYH